MRVKWVSIVVMMIKSLLSGALVEKNPFEDKPWAINSIFEKRIYDAGLDENRAAMFAMRQPSVVWMDRIAAIQDLDGYLSSSNNDTCFIEVYNVPGPRDCAASSSNGELQCESEQCEDGLDIYKHNFLLPIRDILKKYTLKTKILFIETDSLPNSVTNYENPNASPCKASNPPQCSLTAMTAYYNGVIWALNELAVDDKTFFYLDMGHSLWLCWAGQQKYDDKKRPTDFPDPDADGLAQLFIHNIRQILESDPNTKELTLKSSMNNAVNEYKVPLLEGGLREGVVDKIRGFTTNIANRQPLLKRDDDVCEAGKQYNFCLDELAYVDLMDHMWKEAGYEFGYVIDTSRNGGDARKTAEACQQWCNVKSKYNPDGLPQIPDKVWNVETGYVYDPKSKKYRDNHAQLDAFFWIKDVSSDGVSEKNATRFDCMCIRDIHKGFQFDNAPEAGEIFEEMLNYWYP